MSNTSTWSGAKSFEWSLGDNWGGGVPGPDDDAVIPGGGPHPTPEPPAGTVVRNLQIAGNGGLSARLAVTSSFSWLGGSIYAGVELRGARIDIAGRAGQQTGGPLEIRSAGTLTETDIGMSGPIKLLNLGQLTSNGQVRLWWVASQHPALHNRGTLNVDSGTLRLQDFVAVLEGTTVIAPGATLLLETQTDPTFLVRGTISGGGTVCVRNGGIFADTGSVVAGGTTFVLDPGGAVENNPRDNKPFIDDPGTQGLILDGPFTWNGGTIYGDVHLTSTSVLNMSGPDQHGHAGGLVLLEGSGVIAASTAIDLAAGQFRVDGDLLLQSPLDIPEGKGWRFEIGGRLRVAGTQTATLGDNPLLNEGVIEVTQGVLRLKVQTWKLTQAPIGVLTLAAGAELHGDDLMRLGGTVTGAGRIVGDLEALGTVRPGTAPQPGLLSVAGRCVLGPRSRTAVRVDGGTPAQGYSQLLATGPVAVDGTLLVEAGPGFAVQDGQALTVVGSDTALGLTGRFRRATLPRPTGGRFLRVHYTAQEVQLVASTNTGGIDAKIYPSDDVMRQVIQDKHYDWVGYYLVANGHTNASWLGRRAFLAGLGLGFAVVYYARQDPPEGVDAAGGDFDAQDATDKAGAEGFPDGSWLYLDVEWRHEGITPARGEYVTAWARRLLRIGRYVPAVYCPSQDVGILFPGLFTAFRDAVRTDRPRFWTAAVRRPFDPTLPPADGGTPEAIAWQQEMDSTTQPHVETRPNGQPYRVPHPGKAQGDPWHTDVNVAVLADPSAP